MFGTNEKGGYEETDIVEVVIDNFIFQPLDPVVRLAHGELCSLNCQCNDAMYCDHDSRVCLPTTLNEAPNTLVQYKD